jgi:hypothetical protein
MTSGLSSQSRPWFALSIYDEDCRRSTGQGYGSATVEERVYSFLAHTNFYDAVEVGYAELGGFGTEACVMLEDDEQGAVCHPLTFGEYWISLNKHRRPGRSLSPVPDDRAAGGRDLQGQGAQPAPAAYDRSAYEEQFDIYHAIEENDDFIAGRLGPGRQAVALDLLG